MKIPCAILSLFHLLPPAPDKFLAELVAVTMSLEAQLPGSTPQAAVLVVASSVRSIVVVEDQ